MKKILLPLIIALGLVAFQANARPASFKEADGNDDGLVDRSEFGGGPVGSSVFKEWDTNEDGRIDRAEWLRAMSIDNNGREGRQRGEG